MCTLWVFNRIFHYNTLQVGDKRGGLLALDNLSTNPETFRHCAAHRSTRRSNLPSPVYLTSHNLRCDSRRDACLPPPHEWPTKRPRLPPMAVQRLFDWHPRYLRPSLEPIPPARDQINRCRLFWPDFSISSLFSFVRSRSARPRCG